VKQIIYEETQAVYMTSNDPRCSLSTVNFKDTDNLVSAEY